MHEPSTPPFRTDPTSPLPAANARPAPRPRRGRRTVLAASAALAAGATALLAATVLPPPPLVDLTLPARLHEPEALHVDQADLLALVHRGQTHDAFELAFELGDELFEATFNALDGVGADVGDGQRFSRMPRADLARPGAWAAHVPARATGPNAAACNACHRQPADDGAGGADSNVVRDPFHTGDLAQMIHRNTPHLFGSGAVQLLAEEMTVELQAIAHDLEARVRRTRQPATAALRAKGVDFGTLAARWSRGQTVFDRSGVEGVDHDLVVRPFQWKGSVPFLRMFNRNAAHDELGMQAVELVGAAMDGDHDQVVDELTIGDLTALSVYVAAQPRPTTRVELASLGVIPPLAASEVQAIARGGDTFARIGCAGCHVPELPLDDPVFREPSRRETHRDARFPASQNPVAEGVHARFPVQFDLTRDLPDNVLQVNGRTVHLGTFVRRQPGGPATVALYGDLKRHDLGSGLAEGIDETGTGASVFLTENLWGVGSTAPYLHDGRATTLTEAILAHGGEAAAASGAFAVLATGEQADVIAFLDNLVLFKAE